jgi:hypothetical protein
MHALVKWAKYLEHWVNGYEVDFVQSMSNNVSFDSTFHDTDRGGGFCLVIGRLTSCANDVIEPVDEQMMLGRGLKQAKNDIEHITTPMGCQIPL